MTRFWMVARKPASGEKWGNPKMRHYDRTRAVAEAKRLANLTGERFVILGCEETVSPDSEKAEPIVGQPDGLPSMTAEQKPVFKPKKVTRREPA